MTDFLLQIKPVRESSRIPQYATEGAGAVDLVADIDAPIEINAWSPPTLIPTGIKINIGRRDIAALLIPRSGLGHKQGFVLGNSTGLIDSDYQGEIFVSAAIRVGFPPITIKPGDRIAQMLFVPVMRPFMAVVDAFESETARGEGGFGSTGVAASGE